MAHEKSIKALMLVMSRSHFVIERTRGETSTANTKRTNARFTRRSSLCSTHQMAFSGGANHLGEICSSSQKIGTVQKSIPASTTVRA